MKYEIVENGKVLVEHDSFETACREARNFANSSKETVFVVDKTTKFQYYSSRYEGGNDA